MYLPLRGKRQSCEANLKIGDVTVNIDLFLKVALQVRCFLAWVVFRDAKIMTCLESFMEKGLNLRQLTR